MSDKSRRLRIGVDVGGTNTDSVLLDPLETTPESAIKAWHKTPTTADPSGGITEAINHLFKDIDITPEEVASVTIGTTHFVNAAVEVDALKLSPVAVLRLCGPFSKHAPPCIDWPDELKDIVLAHFALLKGGLEVDGYLISDIDEDEIKAECAKIKQLGITSIVVNGVFSPIDTHELQEERVAAIIRAEIPQCEVVCSKEVANLGFLERENAAVLNASILFFAKKTIRSFQRAIKRLGLSCPLFVAQNDGTVLSGEMAARLPIRTFSSGPTNSMRGAAFLVQKNLAEDVMVVDIGGTTTDVGLLHANGFPRQQAAYSELAGVRINLSCPDIKSIGLGGGSIVKRDGGISVGPQSVGHQLTKEGIVFGGNILTATDIAVQADAELLIGDPKLLNGVIGEEELGQLKDLIRNKLERIIDTMKTSPSDLPVILVGGGAVIAPLDLRGASKVLKPEYSQVANAIGAATARVSAVVDTVKSTEDFKEADLLVKVKAEAVQKTVAAGAKPSSVEIVEMEVLPLQYVSNKTRFVVRAAGDFDSERTFEAPTSVNDRDHIDVDDGIDDKATKRSKASSTKQAATKLDIKSYRPDVRGRNWYISETDLDWITIGCYILGTGGGGSPYSSMIRLRTMLRNGATVRVVNPHDIADDAQVGCGGGAGSPTVAIEKLAGDEMMESQTELYKICEKNATHMISLEIGGANGLQSLILGASSHMDLPVVDGDWMGRAYPTKWQTTPVLFNERSPIWSPIAMSDGNGNVVVMPKASSDAAVERILRAALAQMGSVVGAAEPPVTGAETKRWAVEHTISQSWRIGRGVARARDERRLDQVAEAIIDECGGSKAGKVLWKGKIIGVERTLRMGHVYGECLIQGTSLTEQGPHEYVGVLKIPFKNENIAAIRANPDGGADRQEDVLAIVPDLITIIDAQNGEAVGTPEYRYGLVVVVLGLAASNKWTDSERGLKLGGPEGFGFGHLEWKALGTYQAPRSVIDEFDVAA